MKLMSDTNVHLENKRVSRIFFIYIWIMYTTVYMTKNCFAGALSAIVAEGDLTLSQTTTISAAFYLVYAPLQIFGGMFADKYSPERLITIGLIGGAIANLVIFFNQNYYVILISWAFNAIIQFALWPAVFKIMSSQLVRSDRSRMVFIMSFASSAGLAMAYAVSALLPDWRYNFIVSAVILLVNAVILQGFCLKLDPIIKKDRIAAPAVTEESGDGENPTPPKMSTARLFMISGFFMILPPILLRTMVENGTKTLSPTMLMQSYDNISPMVGNFLNLFIIGAGIIGTLLIKFVLYPRIIKNEIMGYFIMLLVSLPFTVILGFVGELPLWSIVLSLCMISMALTATHLLAQYYNMLFIPYAKNGTVAGILNSASSFGLVLQYCVFGLVAENFGWTVVTTTWIGMIAVSIIFTALAIRPANRLKKMTHGE